MGKEEGLSGQVILEFRVLVGKDRSEELLSWPPSMGPSVGPLILSRVVLITGVILLCPEDSLHHNALLNCSGSSVGKEFACSTGDLDSIPGWGRSHGKGNGNPHQYSCLENHG